MDMVGWGVWRTAPKHSFPLRPLPTWGGTVGHGWLGRLADRALTCARLRVRSFTHRCVAGIHEGLEGFHGCILADDMGLGKTLQSITLLWTERPPPFHVCAGTGLTPATSAP